ncbi:MAG: hypothetical protein JRD92_14870 [Deltaproteobacteria bacterium]|nr:hypothetical protein [Deltaproteobacteria bacterium]MBW2588208.1 hypothetical protein [Deltaproteobacteria bacterium]
MASHFGLSGRPDSFMSKEAFFLVRSNLDNGAFMTVLVAYFAFVIAVFVRKMRLLKLPE